MAQWHKKAIKDNNPDQRYRYDNLLNEVENNYQVIEKLIDKLKSEKNKTRLLQNKAQTLRAEKKNLQDQLNNRPIPQPKQPKRINKKALFLGAGLAIAELTNNYYNPGFSNYANQLSTQPAFNNSLSLNYPNPLWENVPNN